MDGENIEAEQPLDTSIEYSKKMKNRLFYQNYATYRPYELLLITNQQFRDGGWH